MREEEHMVMEAEERERGRADGKIDELEAIFSFARGQLHLTEKL